MEQQKVLLIDDDVLLGNIMTIALQEAGYEVAYQASLVAVQSVVREWKPDVIVLDVEVGTRRSIEAVPEITAIAPHTPVLFISSHVEGSDVVQAMDTGGTAYLKKPFETEELVAYVRRYMPSFHPKGIEIGEFSLHIAESLLMRQGQVVRKLTFLECKLLQMLALHLNQTVSREDIERELWNGKNGNEQSLNNYVARLRRYLSGSGSVEILTIPKTGYQLTGKDTRR